jgi:hypothetical protein
MTSVGFPHSDISGSTPACDSPKLFAANHVLHRLLTPRHSPCALSSLTTNLIGTPERVPNLQLAPGRQSRPSLTRGANQDESKLAEIVASLLSLSRYAVYKVECSIGEALIVLLRLIANTLRACDSERLVLKTRFRVVVTIGFSKNVFRYALFRLAAKGVNPKWIRNLRQESRGWSVRGSNPRPPACKAGALPAELTPPVVSQLEWARKDLNFRPHAYQACALTN